MPHQMKSLLAILLVVGSLTAVGLSAQDEELIWQDGRWIRQPPPSEGTAPGEAAIIRRDMHQQKYSQALDQANKFIKRYPGDGLTEQVYDLAGEAELRRERYWQSYEWYEKLVGGYPNGDLFEKALDREMQVARAFMAGKKKLLWGFLSLPAEDDGVKIMERVAERNPGTVRAETALLSVGDYYYDKRKWSDAVTSYDNYMQLFPKSPRASRAELKIAEAYWRSYRGGQFDDTPLNEAQKRYENFNTRYPALARQADVDEVLKRIRSAKADKLLATGTYYIGADHPESTAYYYLLAAKDYADTPAGIQAQKWLDQHPNTRPPAPPAPSSMPALGEPSEDVNP
jgi:outer membrane protein assembly factor BamD (BamD/ComL family)